MSVQQDIDVFLYKAQKRTCTLGDELLVLEDEGMNPDLVSYKLDTILQLDDAIYLLQNRLSTMTDDHVYEIISYLNQRGELNKLPLSLFSFACEADNLVLPGGYLEGPTGATGATGPKGDTGDAGAAGAAGEDGDDGDNGWSPIHAIEADGERRVVKVTGWTGGTGTEPNSPVYLGSSGYVSLIADAADIRGAIGATGATGSAGATGATGASSYTYVAYASDANGTGFTTTFNSDLNYIAIRTTTSPITSPSAGDFTGLWKNYKGEQGEPYEIDAQGSLSDLNTYDDEDEGFTFLDHDAGDVYIKRSDVSGDWGGPFRFLGYQGWSPVLAVVSDGDRRVHQIVDWQGGEGVTKPSVISQYIGELGIVSTPGDAVDIRGTQGERFFPDEQGLEADRDDFDDEEEGFIYYATDLGQVSIKLSDTSADWSAWFDWRGEQGIAGPTGEEGNGFSDDCRVATTATLNATYDSGTKTLTSNVDGAISIDGVTLVLNDRVLDKDQTTGSERGIYKVTTVGDASNPWILTRDADFDSTLDAQKFFQVHITEGTTNAGTKWGMTTARAALVLDTTALTFSEDDPSLSSYMPLSGGTMTGSLDMGGFGIISTNGLTLTDDFGIKNTTNNAAMYFLSTGKIDVDGTIILGDLTASTILELNGSKEIISATKGTAYNKDFGTDSGTVSEGQNAAITTKVSISSLELLALNATPKALLPAPGVGKTYEILGILARLNFGTAAYATNVTLQIQFTGATAVIANNNTILTSTLTKIGKIALAASSGTGGSQYRENIGIEATVGTGNPTTGDGSLDLYITYKIITL